MKIRKYKYLGPVDNYKTKLISSSKPHFLGIPVSSRNYTKNDSSHLHLQGKFIDDKEPKWHCDNVFIKYPFKL